MQTGMHQTKLYNSFASVLEVQISNTMSGESKGHVRIFFRICHIYVYLQTLLHPLLYEMNLHSESVLIHLPPSSSTSASPFWAICPSRSSLITGLVNAKFSGCALLRSNPQIICQTRKRYAITLNPEPNSVLNA